MSISESGVGSMPNLQPFVAHLADAPDVRTEYEFRVCKGGEASLAGAVAERFAQDHAFDRDVEVVVTLPCGLQKAFKVHAVVCYNYKAITA